MTKHKCKREKLVWELEPHFDGEAVWWIAKCPKCGHEYQQVFTENDGLYDPETSSYVYI